MGAQSGTSAGHHQGRSSGQLQLQLQLQLVLSAGELVHSCDLLDLTGHSTIQHKLSSAASQACQKPASISISILKPCQMSLPPAM